MMIQMFPIDYEEPQRKAFKAWMCRKFGVESVDDLDMTTPEYCLWMDCWESAISFRNEELIEWQLKKNK